MIYLQMEWKYIKIKLFINKAEKENNKLFEMFIKKPMLNLNILSKANLDILTDTCVHACALYNYKPIVLDLDQLGCK